MKAIKTVSDQGTLHGPGVDPNKPLGVLWLFRAGSESV